MPIGYVKQPVKAKIEDVTVSRVKDTEYQNTTGRPLLVVVCIVVHRAAVAGAAASADGRIGPSSGILTMGFTVESMVQLGILDNELEEIQATLVIPVPNQYYYAVKTTVMGAGSTSDVAKWIEVEL